MEELKQFDNIMHARIHDIKNKALKSQHYNKIGFINAKYA